MGLIKAAIDAVSSTLHDQWKEAIRCENMGNDVLMVKKTTPTGVITSGSVIIVAPGQCAILYDNGKILDATAEDGAFTYENSSSPSLFAGQFGEMFKEMWQRFTFDGASAKEQAVFYFNLKEIMGNKFGTAEPIMYRDWEHAVLNPRTNSLTAMRLGIRAYGTYTFKINDPFLFMSRIAGSANVFRKDELVKQMQSEISDVFMNVTNSLCSEKYKVYAMDLPNQTDEIKAIMKEGVYDEPIRARGITIESFAIENVSFDDESKAKIDEYELGGDAFTQQGSLVNSYGKAIESAAKNENGAMNGFMGIGMLNGMSGNMFGTVQNNIAQNMQNAAAMQQAQNATQPQQPVQNITNNDNSATENNGTWKCPKCGNENVGKFCSECGEKKPEELTNCPKCGTKLTPGAKFCPECGEKLV